MVKKSQAIRTTRPREIKQNKSLERSRALLKFVLAPRVIAVIGLCVLTVTLYAKLDVKQVLPIESVKIEGEFQYLDKESLRNNVLSVIDGGFVGVNLPVVRDSLINLPWVEDVSVRREWPAGLLIRVIEKQPVVYWNENGVLSAKGKLFVPQARLSLNLPKLKGPEGQHKYMLKEMARMQAWLLETGLHIQFMEQDARRSWVINMSNGIEIRLGRKNIHERLRRFVSVYESNLKTTKREIAHIDMRYTNGLAVAWKEA